MISIDKVDEEGISEESIPSAVMRIGREITINTKSIDSVGDFLKKLKKDIYPEDYLNKEEMLRIIEASKLPVVFGDKITVNLTGDTSVDSTLDVTGSTSLGDNLTEPKSTCYW